MSATTPSEYAAQELAMWEAALREQRQAEDQLELARQSGPRLRVTELLPHVEALRTRADLLLAEAVKVKCTFRDHTFPDFWVTTTPSGDAANDGA